MKSSFTLFVIYKDFLFTFSMKFEGEFDFAMLIPYEMFAP